MRAPLFRNSLAFLLAVVFVATSAMAKEVVEIEKDGVRLILGTSTIPETVGEMVPVTVTFEKAPLRAGDKLSIFADATHLAYTITPTKGFLLRGFTGRVRMNQGELKAVVSRSDGATIELAQRVTVDRRYSIPEDGNATKEFKARGKGNTFELIHRNRMALANYVELIDIGVPAGGLTISMTPYSSGLAYYRIEAEHSLEGHVIDLQLATKRFVSEQ